jgi:hypothetical protein
MDLSQIAFLSALALACWFGRREPMIGLVVALNCFATIASAGSPLTVAIADLLAIAVLMVGNARSKVVAAFFVAMVPLYPIGLWFDLPKSTIYTIVDVLAYLQLVVVGRGDNGIGRGLRRAYRLLDRSRVPVGIRASAPASSRLASTPDRG